MESCGELKTLTEYAQRGILIRYDPDYDKSPIGQLENFVFDHIKSLRILKNQSNQSGSESTPSQDEKKPLLMSSIRGYLGSNSIRKDNDFLERMFYAVVAPSMEGKTQSAFVFRNIRPLYFLLVKTSLSASHEIQDIYRNFATLSDKFMEIAVTDFTVFLKKTQSPVVSVSIYDRVSAEVLIKNHGETPFLLLGFLVALIEHAKAEFDPSQTNWMEFFATSPRKFTIRAMSINQVRKIDLENYVLFFDEFAALNWTVFVRNLARAARIPLFVANTNTNAANLVGRDQSAFSSTDPNFAWSLVSIRLNSMTENILHGMNLQFFGKLNELSQLATGKEQDLVIGFIKDFLDNQLKQLRPGFAEWISQAIVAIPVAQSITLNYVLTEIIKELVSRLIKKKPQMMSNLEAVLGTFALFMNNAYLSEDDSELTHICHRKIYLQDHFYYLANPVDNTKWAFLTYPPAPKPATASESVPFSEKPLRVVKDNNNEVLSDWKKEFTYFKSEEIIPFLAFQAIMKSGSIGGLFKKGMDEIKRSPRGTGDTQNMAQNVALNGNELEVLATVCVTEASHHFCGDVNSTFCGQDGISFVTNLVENLVEADGFRHAKNVIIDFHERTVGVILEKMHVPYLFPSEMDLPKFFKDHLSDAEGFNFRSVNFGEFHRTKNEEEIDATFKYFIKNGQNKIPTVATCAIECKNWSQNLSVELLKNIINKAVNFSANLSLVFCNTLSSAHGQTIDSFKQICTDNKWNVLKLMKTNSNGDGKKNFKLDRYFSQLSFSTDPSLTCIVLELATINS